MSVYLMWFFSKASVNTTMFFCCKYISKYTNVYYVYLYTLQLNQT